tara:strand:+ start:82 stop:276 length:195 start_codon:yes stop_codon:yes gene_type:complete
MKNRITEAKERAKSIGTQIKGNTSRITIFVDQRELTTEAITKLGQLINKKAGVTLVRIERNLIG